MHAPRACNKTTPYHIPLFCLCFLSQSEWSRFNSDLTIPPAGAVHLDTQAYQPDSYLNDGGLGPIFLGAILQPMPDTDLSVEDTFRRSALGMEWMAELM